MNCIGKHWMKICPRFETSKALCLKKISLFQPSQPIIAHLMQLWRICQLCVRTAQATIVVVFATCANSPSLVKAISAAKHCQASKTYLAAPHVDNSLNGQPKPRRWQFPASDNTQSLAWSLGINHSGQCTLPPEVVEQMVQKSRAISLRAGVAPPEMAHLPPAPWWLMQYQKK